MLVYKHLLDEVFRDTQYHFQVSVISRAQGRGQDFDYSGYHTALRIQSTD